MTSTVEHALDDVKRRYDELNRALSGLFPQFRDASEKLLNELMKKVQDLEQKDELYRAKAENDKARIERLEEENQLLRQDKLDHEKLRTASDRLTLKLDDYSRQIDTLNEQNRQMSDQYRLAERELTSLTLKNNELNGELTRKVREFDEFKDQCELEKRTELNNQAIDHQHAMVTTKETLQKSLKKLKADFDRQEKELRQRNEEVTQLRKELKAAPFKYHAEAVRLLRTQAFQVQQHTDPARVSSSPMRYKSRDNPVKPMQRALGGSSISTSTSSTSSYNSRRHNNEEPIRKRPHY